MFAQPGILGAGIGRLGLGACALTLVAQALAILAKYGSAANLYLPGVGQINGLQAGNWLDIAGTTAATVDGQVGLVVSAGKAVGPELVLDIDFNDPSKWILIQPTSGSVSVSGGTLNISSLDGSFCQAAVFPYVSGVVGRSVSYEIQIDSVTGTGISIAYGGAVSPSFTSPGIYRGVLTAVNTTALTIRRASGAFSAVVQSISVRELPGAHLTQSTAANRPVLRLSGGVYAWDFVSSDSFTSTMTPGNAGFFCSGANVTDSGVLRTLLGAGAGSDASSGVWLARAASNALTLQVGNGTTRNSISAAYPVATNAVASAGWDGSSMFVGINGTETSAAKSVNCTSTNTINVGVLTGTSLPMLGTISGGAVIMPTVLPTATERATLRKFIAALSGVTM